MQYVANGQNQYAFPTTITDAAGNATHVTYDYNAGKANNADRRRIPIYISVSLWRVLTCDEGDNFSRRKGRSCYIRSWLNA